MRRIIYPATRAVENASALPGVRPVRLFPVLWPLWQIETSAEIYDRQDFEIVDHFVVRAIEEGQIRDSAELSRFLNVPAGLVERCLAFLRLIGHVTADGSLQLTELGRRSIQDGVRYVATKSRQTILIERQTGWPLPRAYYDANVPVLDTPEIEDGQLVDRTRFLRVFTTVAFQPEVLRWLEDHPDRAQYNLPGQLRNLSNEGVREGYLPSYLIETADHKILAYTNVSEQRDTFLESLCNRTSINNLIQAKGFGDPEQIWRKWLAKSTVFGGGRLHRSAQGWRIVLDASAFGDPPKLPYHRLGAYQFYDSHFIQVRCDDPAARRRVLVTRSLSIATLPGISTEQELQDRIRDLASSLEVAEISVADLRAHAASTGDDDRLHRLENLG
jgi:hypothetical protein